MKKSISLIVLSTITCLSLSAAANSGTDLHTCSATADQALQGIGFKVGPPYGAYEGKVLTVLDTKNQASGPVGSIRLDGKECEIELDSSPSLQACAVTAAQVLKGINYQVGPPYGAYDGKVLTVLDSNDPSAGPIGSVMIDGNECQIELE